MKSSPLLVLSHPRRILNDDGYYECVYTNFITQNFDDNDINVIEGYYDGTHKKPIQNNKIFYSDIINYISRIYYYLKRKKIQKQVNYETKNDIVKLIKEVENKYKVILSVNEIQKIITKKYLFFVIKHKIYSLILRKSKPKVIIEVVGYNFDNKVVNKVARDMSIPIIELQHGAIDKYNINYNFQKNYKSKYMAEYLLTFSDIWSKELSLPINVEPISIGFPFYEKQKNKYISKYQKQNKSKKIIFVSQRPVGVVLSNFAVELYNKLEKNNIEYDIIYKLHPGEFDIWKQEYSQLYAMRDKISVIANSDDHIYKYFAQSDIQIGVYSFGLFEGIGFGLETYILSTNVDDYSKIMTNNTKIQLINNTSKIVEDIKENLNTKINKNNEENSELFFKNNSVENFNFFIKQFIEN